MADHPYRSLDALHFWSRSVAPVAFHEIDPIRSPKFQVGAAGRVATIGSCFAQNLSRFLVRSGLNYFVTESGEESLGDEEQVRRNYGTFSARYGNVYTVRQALQLFERAYTRRWARKEEIWRRDEVFVDSLRPQIEPAGFSTEAELEADRREHLAAVRRVFEQADVLVFTLGLTEGWRVKRSGLVLPVVPGASGGSFDGDRYEFVNFGVNDVIADLRRFVQSLRKVNSNVKILLTVSPVPLIATYTDEHVLTATTYSKSVLRVAAADVSNAFDYVDYFPSFEIITNASAGGRYFADDLRSITEAGVAHVMRIFKQHYLDGTAPSESTVMRQSLRSEIAAVQQIICDEEVLDPKPPINGSVDQIARGQVQAASSLE